MTVTLIPSADALRDELHARYGKSLVIWTVGDRAHAARVSDHNPERWANEKVWDGQVHAIDIVNFPRLDALVEWLRLEAKNRREPRITYLIRNRRIASAKSAWEWRRYDGEDDHRQHAHISFSYVTRYENDRSRWLVGFDKPKLPGPKPVVESEGSGDFGAWYRGAPGSRVNQLWDAGEDVRVLQEFIGNTVADGYFGRGTLTAVKWYQDLRGLTPIDGIAGPKTWAPILRVIGS